MFAPFLLTIVLVSANADNPPDVATWIGRLGSSSFDDRVAAYKALELLGGEALPSLRAVAETSDARVRTRVRALIESIGRQVETNRFVRSTLIHLDFRNRPLSEVVEALNDRHDLGLTLRLSPEPRRGMMGFGPDPDQPQRLKALRNREITLEAAQPLAFWEALDRLCQAGALRYDVSPRNGFGTSPGYLVLIADHTGRGPVSDSGPFRVQVTGAASDFDPDFPLDPDPERPRRGARSRGVTDLTVPLAVLPEPGLMLHQNGAVIVTEATDDRGRSLETSAPAKPDPRQANRSRQFGNGQAAIQVNAVLKALDPPVKVIRRLQGKVPVIAVTRASDPIVIPLKGEGVLGKPFSTRDMALMVDEVSLAPGAPAWVQVTLRFHGGNFGAIPRFDPSRPDFTVFDRERVLEHLELHDAAGKRLSHTTDGQIRGADVQGFYDRYQLFVTPGSEGGPGASKTPIPSELRYYGFVQKVTEVPFDFRDIPMP